MHIPLTIIIITVFSSNPTNLMIQAVNEEDFEENNSIMICSTWGENLGDGKLTYRIEGRVEPRAREAVRDAISDWDDKIDFLEFIEIPEDQEKQQNQQKPDIQVDFIKDGAEFGEYEAEMAGHTKTRLNKFGFIKYNLVTIAEGGLGETFDKKTIETIAKHEIGHTLGLGHANFNSNLMTTEIDYAPETISPCELEAVPASQ